MDKEKMYEEFLGIKTDDEEIMPGNEKELEYSLYEASEYEGLVKIFDTCQLTQEDTLVDFGCGMGRVLFYCNQRFLCRVTGIEYDKEIYDRLCDNAEYYHVRFKNQKRKFSLLHMKAEEYDIEPTDNYFYMFNPFCQDIMHKVMDKIMDSGRRYPRKITVIFYYCTKKMLATMRDYPFGIEQIIKLPAYRIDPDEKAYIFSHDFTN